MDEIALESTKKLLNYLKDSDLSGYDVNDALNIPMFENIKSKKLRLAISVFFRKSPIEFRPFFGMKKGHNPKGMGLFLSAYSRLYAKGILKDHSRATEIYNWLIENPSKGYGGLCWGYNYPWQNRNRLLPRYTPTVVNTAYVGHGILDYYDITKSPDALKMALSACDFILNDLHITERKEGLCFSYTPLEADIVYNASALGASFLARTASYINKEELLVTATKAMNFITAHQHSDGRWDYGKDIDSGKVDIQTDWHQGFICDSYAWYTESIKKPDKTTQDALMKGVKFYRDVQFDEHGRCYRRHPRFWPVNTHNQAQGIITFSRTKNLIPNNQTMVDKILKWTVENMQSKKEGFFYFEKHPNYMNKINYIRMSQAWMLYALSWYL